MKKLLSIMVLLVILGLSAFASTSTNYAISTEVFDLGGASIESTSYGISGKLREIKPEVTTSSGYTLEGRFSGIVYGGGIVSTVEVPAVTAIIPNAGYNDRSYAVVINGANISTDATAKLSKAGSNVYGSSVKVDSSTSMECTFSLIGVRTGSWNVIVMNTGWAKEGILTNGFTVSAPGPVQIIGTPVNEPNPFNPNEGSVKIKYNLSAAASISLYLFNQNGELVWQKTFSAGENGGKAGENTIDWSGISDFGENVPTGVYVLRIISKSVGVKELGRIKIAVLRK